MSDWAASAAASDIAPPLPARWSGSYDRRHPTRLCRTAGSARAVEPADPVVAVAPGAAAAAPHRFSADPDAVRHHPQGGDPSAHALVAHAAAARLGGAGYHRRGRTAVES